MKNKIKYLVLILVLCLGLSVPVLAEASTMVYDDADLLTDAEEDKLNDKLTDISNKHNAEVVVVTVESTNGVNLDKYVNNLYDSKGFGYGANHDGVMLLICMETRDYRILSNGYAGNVIKKGDIDNAIVSDLSAGRYYSAFDKYADKCDYYLNNSFDFTRNLLYALGIGIVVALVVVFILKGQLKSVRRQNLANDYVRSGSMHVTHSREIYLYKKVTSRRKESNNSSSRSGSSRSVSGGKF